jgi:hypothetical protein
MSFPFAAKNRQGFPVKYILVLSEGSYDELKPVSLEHSAQKKNKEIKARCGADAARLNLMFLPKAATELSVFVCEAAQTEHQVQQ